MNGTITRVAVTLLLAGTAACSAGMNGDNGPRRNPDQISVDEVEQASVRNAFELVQRLRPAWLQKRGVTSIQNEGDIAVYLDGMRIGGPERLREIPTISVESLEFLDAGSATQRWGTGHTHGAILIHSSTGRRS